MIKLKVAELLGKNKMTRKKLSELTGVRPNTIGDLYNENAKKINIETLDKMCKVFKCNVSDILEYKDDSNSKK